MLIIFSIGYYGYTKNYHFIVVKTVGQFDHISYMNKNIIGIHGSYGNHGHELCSRTQNKCWDKTNILGEESKLMRASSVGLGHFVNTELGVFLPCLNCQQLGMDVDNSYFGLPTFKVVVGYSNNQNSTLLATFNHPNTSVKQLGLVSYNEKGVTITPLLLEGGVSSFKGFSSPNGQEIAWFDCSEKCTLARYHIQTKKIERQRTVCKYSRYLEIKWEDEGPAIRQHSNAIRGTKLISGEHIGLCKNNNGDAAYPVWTAEEYKAKYSV